MTKNKQAVKIGSFKRGSFKTADLKTKTKTLNGVQFSYRTMLGVNGDSKTVKGLKLNYLTGIMYLTPSDLAKQYGYNVINTCKRATADCIKTCLYNAGRGRFNNVQTARLNKTVFLLNDKTDGLTSDGYNSIIADIIKLVKRAVKNGLKPAVRLNGTSDLPFYSIIYLINLMTYNFMIILKVIHV